MLACSSYYKIGYIDTLWVSKNYRGKGIGAELLSKAESDLRELGCQMTQLATFDFQGPDFYKKQGYVEFGKLYYPNADLTEYYLKKDIS
ncbi:MAG: GNAT family N-acetyltransferase [Alkalibacterium sp.]|nr:GNAT family N-acetyltransferase [Alkalibacterium sp.]